MFTMNDSLVAFDYGPTVLFYLQHNIEILEHTFTIEDLQRQYSNETEGIGALMKPDYHLA